MCRATRPDLGTETAAKNLFTGPVAALTDRVRDAIRDATRDSVNGHPAPRR